MMLADPEAPEFTPEQLAAIDTRAGELFLDAAAGSGKTSVLVERFAQGVVADGVDVSAILTITFTEKAAAQMRDRIRARLWDLGAAEAARATEEAYISTIHGFCARLLRAHALRAGIDPTFRVLDEFEAGRLADGAFDAALTDLAERAPGGVELIASYGAGELRAGVQSVYAELRSRGERGPRLPALPDPPDARDALASLEAAAAVLAAEMGAIASPSSRVVLALGRLERLGQVLAESVPWPGELDALGVPGGNGAALSSPACLAYAEALARLRAASAQRWARPALDLLARLLAGFGERYEARKRERSGLDFEDLEVLCRDLLRADDELRDRYRQRFQRVMVDELQDTNAVQVELIEMVSNDNLFTVGDGQQSIYGFRHADVELFERRGRRMAERGRRATLQTNFRSRPEILDVVNRVFAAELGEGFLPLAAARPRDPLDGERVELIVADKDGEWAPEGSFAPWRVAEARALGRRIEELVATGAAPRDVVVLTRATTDMRAYERALEERGIATYTVGGRGYWSHPQVVDLVSYLRVLANPRDEEALYGVLASPLVGVSLDALVVLAAGARAAGRDPWWVLREPGEDLAELEPAERRRLSEFVQWLADERRTAPRLGIEELLDRVIERTGYDLAVLALPGGQRRLANVRKLMRLGRSHLAEMGPDVRGFLELVRLRTLSWRADPDDAEAPIESEALDAVRLMTIHRAKGLEFETVCVADLGRSPRTGAPMLRVGGDGQVGLRLSRPGTGARVAALDYEALGEQRRQAEAREERRLFYVAMTRARERLILSGAARLESWGPSGGPPMGWLGPALVEDISPGEGVREGVRFSVVRPADVDPSAPISAPRTSVVDWAGLYDTPDRPRPRALVTSLSYTALAAYERCGYRFYVERLLGVPGSERRAERPTRASHSLDAAERGTLVHALLERLDLRRPVVPDVGAIRAAAPHALSDADVAGIVGLMEGFARSEVRARLGRAVRVWREQRFAFPLDDVLITGILDVIAGEPGNRTLIVDYKSDRLDRADPPAIVDREYGTQQLIYALAALRAGAGEVEVLHLFLEAPANPVSVTFTRDRVPELERSLAESTRGVAVTGSFTVTDAPRRDVCRGCPAEGGLCSWPLEMTRRESPDQLF